MSLFHMGLVSFEPIESSGCLASLTKLEYVDGSFNKITELSNSMLAWSALRVIAMGNNGIVTQIPSTRFEAFPHLKYLSLTNNEIIMDMTNTMWNRLVNLEYLYLDHNRLQGSLPQNSFDNMHSLLELDLSGNNITGRLPNFINSQILQHLDLSMNSFEGNCTGWTMPYLVYLSLANNNLVEPQENLPRNFQSLQFLDLSTNGLTTPPDFSDFGAYLFSLMPLPLETVHLESNQFTGVWDSGFLQTYPSLAHVFLAHNQLTSLPIDIFSIGSETLVDLDVSFNLLVGSLPTVPPPPPTTTLKFMGNPGLQDPNLQLPS